MKEKLEFLLKNKGLTATSLARLLEIQPSGLSHILSGRNKPSFDLVVKILKAFPDVNPDWLLLDSTEIFRGEARSISMLKPLHHRCPSMRPRITKSQSLKKSRKMILLPFFRRQKVRAKRCRA